MVMDFKREFDSGDLGDCRVFDCDAKVVHVLVEMTHEERATPRLADGTPDLFPTMVNAGELLFRIFEVTELCEVDHRVCFERHFSAEKRFMFDTPFVLIDEPFSFDSMIQI